MHVGDRVNLGRWSGAELTHGICSKGGARVPRLAILPKPQPVRKRNALVQGTAGGRPVRYTAVNNELGVFRNRFRIVGLLDSGQRSIAKGLKPDEKQKTGKYRPVNVYHKPCLRSGTDTRHTKTGEKRLGKCSQKAMRLGENDHNFWVRRVTTTRLDIFRIYIWEFTE